MKLTGICYWIDEQGALKACKSFVDEQGAVTTQIEDAEQALAIVTVTENQPLPVLLAAEAVEAVEAVEAEVMPEKKSFWKYFIPTLIII